MSTPSTTAPKAVAVFDGRPFFEKALQHGVRHGVITPARLDAMCQEAPKGMVQIARYFGTEYLRPDLEKARDRLVNLVSRTWSIRPAATWTGPPNPCATTACCRAPRAARTCSRY